MLPWPVINYVHNTSAGGEALFAVVAMLTPHFELSQDAEFVYVKIRVLQLRPDDCEVHAEGNQFRFYMRPYFLRLTFRQRLQEDGRGRAEHDPAMGLLIVQLSKENAGEHFDDLNMITELLRKRSPAIEKVRRGSSVYAALTIQKEAATVRNPQKVRPTGTPLIEVLSSTPTPGEGNRDSDSECSVSDYDDLLDPADPVDMNELLAFEAIAEQEVPSLRIHNHVHRYGFNAAYSDVFTGLDDAELLEISSHESIFPEERRTLRLNAEAAAFEADHYMADFMEDAAVSAALDYTPWWFSAVEERVREHAQEGCGGESYHPRRPSPWGSSSATFATPTVAAINAWCSIGSVEQQQLQQFPRKEYLMGRRERRMALCGLVDLLFAYCYDVRTTAGEASCESGWTIRQLSSQLSWLERFENVRDAAVACVRRSLCYPMLRHWELALAVLRDVLRLLELGRAATLRALLRCRQLLQTTVEYGHLLNRVWLDDYCIWLQQQPPRYIARLATSLRALELRKSNTGWPLQEYEKLAATPDDKIELVREEVN